MIARLAKNTVDFECVTKYINLYPFALWIFGYLQASNKTGKKRFFSKFYLGRFKSN
jgi:hypothetical protein